MSSIINDDLVNEMSLDKRNKCYSPTLDFIAQANINYEEYEKLKLSANNDDLGYWASLARRYIVWNKEFTQTFNNDNAPFYKWFEDGKLSVSYNCLDRHLTSRKDQNALIAVSDNGSISKITYGELYKRVCKFANALRSLGVKKGDRVVLYLPNTIEAITAIHACVRIGAIHSVVFGGFSAKALADRIDDTQAKLVITGNWYRRGGKLVPLKHIVNQALDLTSSFTSNSLPPVVVIGFTSDACDFDPRTNYWYHDLMKEQSSQCDPEIVDAEHPLFILYTSGSTGKPKGVQHCSAGYILGAMYTLSTVFDVKDNDVFWCTADIGWITGHTYVAYGPLLLGLTQVIFDGVPTFPNSGRFWEIIQNHKVSIFYTAPTAIRSLIKLGADLPNNYNLASLRLLGTVGEPINPDAWYWYYNTVGKARCPIVDTWWQTETGANIIAPIPGVTTLKPGSCTHPLPGIDVALVDKAGKVLGRGEEGYLVIRKSYPFQLRTLWNNPEKYKDTYYPKDIADGKYYVAGDSAYIDQDGYFWITGRLDDVFNVSGHRIGTMEVESSIASFAKVAECAVIGRDDEIKGESVFAFIVCKSEQKPQNQEQKLNFLHQINNCIVRDIGAIAKPSGICFVDALPKTRSGKIMRRILRAIANGQEITQDTSTLENPAIINNIKQEYQNGNFI